MIIYIVSDGKKGHLSQTRGLAHALMERARAARPDAVHETHEVDVSGKSWLTKLCYKGKDLDLPHPDLILCAGHGTHLAALSLARHLRCLCMVCMKPSLPTSFFDLCVIPRHDLPEGKEAGPHIFPTAGALNSIRPAPETEKRETLILIGGPSRDFDWDEEMVINQLSTIARHNSSPMVLTTSRRTPADFARDVLSTCPSIRVVPVEQTGPTWVADHLARAREVWVTQDSVSMVYEALSSGAPVGVIEMPRRGDRRRKQKPSRVVRGLGMLVKEGQVCAFTEWAKTHKLPTPGAELYEAGRTADYILSRFPQLLP